MLRLEEEIKELKQKYSTFRPGVVPLSEFADYPLSIKTVKGLRNANFITSTRIQQESILPGLLGKNVVAVAETGSGKSLAFLIPVLEHLFVNKWSRIDGLAALIISPTRELAYQLFETLKKIGKYHDFSAALIIGGKNLVFEKSRVDQCNILICTPGRLLQHMDENPLFNVQSIEMLVLDEADRCLDMGFETCLNAILKHLPSNRQTLLFSATLNNSDFLIRLNLQNPVYVSTLSQVQKKNLVALPELLQQSYVVTDLQNKITMIWSFIISHLKQKILVFLSSCKQVKYIFEIFCKLRPGISLLALYGTLKQDRRISIYNEFFQKRHCVLFATDIASRGLDFPDVNWVVQLDCPEDVTQYIHRAGRCARNKSFGENILVLMPSEENDMLANLKQHNIHLRKIEINYKKLVSPEAKMKAFCARSPGLKLSAQRAFTAYLKSIFLMKNKLLFDVKCLKTDKFAESLGLLSAPRLRFLEPNFKTKSKITENTQEDDFFTVKLADDAIFNDEKRTFYLGRKAEDKKKLKKVSLAKKILKKNTTLNKRFQYDEEGNKVIRTKKERFYSCPKFLSCSNKHFDLNCAQEFLLEADLHDKERFKETVKTRHKQAKIKRIIRKCTNRNARIQENDSENLNRMYGNRKSKKFKISEKFQQSNSDNISMKDFENIASVILTNSI